MLDAVPPGERLLNTRTVVREALPLLVQFLLGLGQLLLKVVQARADTRPPTLNHGAVRHQELVVDQNRLRSLLEVDLALAHPRFGGGQLLLGFVPVLAHSIQVRELALYLLLELAEDPVLTPVGLRAAPAHRQPPVRRVKLALEQRHGPLDLPGMERAALFHESFDESIHDFRGALRLRIEDLEVEESGAGRLDFDVLEQVGGSFLESERRQSGVDHAAALRDRLVGGCLRFRRRSAGIRRRGGVSPEAVINRAGNDGARGHQPRHRHPPRAYEARRPVGKHHRDPDADQDQPLSLIEKLDQTPEIHLFNSRRRVSLTSGSARKPSASKVQQPGPPCNSTGLRVRVSGLSRARTAHSTRRRPILAPQEGIRHLNSEGEAGRAGHPSVSRGLLPAAAEQRTRQEAPECKICAASFCSSF